MSIAEPEATETVDIPDTIPEEWLREFPAEKSDEVKPCMVMEVVILQASVVGAILGRLCLKPAVRKVTSVCEACGHLEADVPTCEKHTREAQGGSVTCSRCLQMGNSDAKMRVVHVA